MQDAAALPGFQIAVAGHDLHFKPYVIDDPIVNGQQLLQLIGTRPPSEYLIYRWMPSGVLEEIHPEERTDLRTAGAEKFVYFRSDRGFRFMLDERMFDWGATHISGATLKKLAGIDPQASEVWLDTTGGDDRTIADTELVDLDAPGVERFVTKAIEIKVFVNGKPRTVHVRRLAYWDVVRLGYPEATPSDGVLYTIDYAFGPPANPEGTLADPQQVVIKNGMKFYVTPTDKS
jgi:hypothetical protein